MLLPFFRTSWGVGVLNSAIFNSFHNRVEFGTILEGLQNFGGGGVWTPQTPPRYATVLFHIFLSFLTKTSRLVYPNYSYLSYSIHAWGQNNFYTWPRVCVPLGQKRKPQRRNFGREEFRATERSGMRSEVCADRKWQECSLMLCARNKLNSFSRNPEPQ